MPSTPVSPVALITGAGSGIGRATAVLLSSRGYRLSLVGRTRQTLEQTAALCPGEAHLIQSDVSAPSGAHAAVDDTVSHFARLDALVNNAGSAPNLPIDAHTPEVLDDIYRVNALAPANLIARAWPTLVRQGSGCIVNLSTMGTIDPFPGFFGYAGAKAAVNLMALCCAREGKADNIRAFAIAPGAVETPMLRGNFPESMLPRSKVLPPETIARLILDCIEGRRDPENGGVIPVPSPS